MVDIFALSLQISYFKLLISFAFVLGIRYLLTQKDDHTSSEKSKAVSLLWWGGAALVLSDAIIIIVWDQGSMVATLGFFIGGFLNAFFLYCLDHVIFEKRLKYIPAIVAGILGVIGLFSISTGEPTSFQNIIITISGICYIALILGLIIVIIVQYRRLRISLPTAVYLCIFFGIILLGPLYMALEPLILGPLTPETFEIRFLIQRIVMEVFSVLKLLVIGLEVLAFQLDALKEVESLDVSP